MQPRKLIDDGLGEHVHFGRGSPSSSRLKAFKSYGHFISAQEVISTIVKLGNLSIGEGHVEASKVA